MTDPDATTTDRMLDFDLDNMLYWADRPKQYAAGRRCCHDGCKTILSRYNGGETCELHRPTPDYGTYCGFRVLTCPVCGAQRIPHSKTTTDPVCQTCRNKLRKQAEPMLELALRTDHHVCGRCGRALPITAVYWRLYTKKDGSISPRGYCRHCKSQERTERYRSHSGAGERMRHYDRYYIGRYGMTRAEYRGNS